LPVQATLLRQNNIVAFGYNIIASILIVVSQYCQLCATLLRLRNIIARLSNIHVFAGSKIDPPSVYGAKIPHTISGPKFAPIRFTG